MKIINKQFENLFKEFPIRSQESESDPLVITKLFNPAGAQTWYLTEYDPESKIAFGYAMLGFGANCYEWGSMDVQELENFSLPLGLTIERDLYSDFPKRFSEMRV